MSPQDPKPAEKILLDASKLQLPATADLMLSKTSLDEEERAGKTSLDFLKAHPRRKRKPVDNRQGNWQALASVLQCTTSVQKREEPAPSDWHEIPEAVMTPELQRDLRIIENRQYLDPKRFYKASGTGRRRGELPSRVQVGTVVVGAHEFYSSRLTRRERRGRIMDQVLADERIRTYTKTRFQKLQSGRVQKRVVDPAARRKGGKSQRW